MGTLTFSADEIRNKLWSEYKLRPRCSTSSNPEATISLVHNQGVYLIAHSKIEESRPEESIVYAEGCDPSKDADWQETSRVLVGGDDFSQELPPEWFEAVLASDEQQLCIKTSKSSIEKAPK
ncbi:DUF3085 domain-containing protein [Vibrio parahaemolyticus]|nr:DUF3085 domain-containing protein [Vibrio parahaemolyticus]TBT46510.1 DUF3085 domain-containing protein [Vibrio parahaemolyticus]